jgi:hypothetical protein
MQPTEPAKSKKPLTPADLGLPTYSPEPRTPEQQLLDAVNRTGDWVRRIFWLLVFLGIVLPLIAAMTRH